MGFFYHKSYIDNNNTIRLRIRTHDTVEKSSPSAIHMFRRLLVLTLAFLLLLTGLPVSAAESLSSSTSPNASLTAIRPAGAVVDEEYSEKILTFDDSEFSRTVSFTASFEANTSDNPENASASFKDQHALPEGLSFDSDTGVLYGTPATPGILTMQFYVSWQDSDSVPAFVRNADPVILKIWPAGTTRLDPKEKAENIDLNGFDNTIEPKGEGQWFSFTAPCLNIAIVDEYSSSQDNDDEFNGTPNITVVDKNGLIVSSLGQDKSDSNRWGYYLTAGYEYFVYSNVPFSIQPESIDISKLTTGTDSSIWWESTSEKNIYKVFDNEENTQWDVYNVHTSSNYNFGLLNYGYMYTCRTISYIAPYKVYFDEPETIMTGAADAYCSNSDSPNSISENAFVHSTEYMSTISSFHYLTSQEPVYGTGTCDVKMYVPAGKDFYLLDGVIRDKNSVTDPESVDASKILDIKNHTNGITLKWQKSKYSIGYKLQRRLASQCKNKKAWKTIATINSASKTTYTDVNVKDGTVYNYRIFNIPKQDYTIDDEEIGYYTFARLSTPSIRSVANIATQKALVKWNKDTKVSGYQILYTTSSLNNGKIITIKSANAQRYTISKLKKKKTYKIYFRTYKVNGNGTGNSISNWSKARTITIQK